MFTAVIKAGSLVGVGVALSLAAALADASPRSGHRPMVQPPALPAHALPGGATTHILLQPGTSRSVDAFSHPAANLTSEERARFALGHSFFRQPWVRAPASVSARDGLGPLFSASSCQACHVRNGRGPAPATESNPVIATVLRIADQKGLPLPVYGDQLQTQAVAPLVPEAQVRVHWKEQPVDLPDGTSVSLRKPVITARNWSHGTPDNPYSISPRIAPPMIGLGLLGAIDDAKIRDQARRSPFGGRVNEVPAAGGVSTVGRFGWKASQRTVHGQSLKAFAADLGITSERFPLGPCAREQSGCQDMPQGGRPELEPDVEESVVFYARHLAPPARRDFDLPEVREGEDIFNAIGCGGCHRAQWKTGKSVDAPALSGQLIFPYTDLLLHDLGEELGDGVREFAASGRQWRTAPLWGVGLTQTVSGARAGYLHDGRARTLQEAILWHGGTAAPVRQRWMDLNQEDRRRVLRFLESL